MDIENYLSCRLELLPENTLLLMRVPIMKNYPDLQLAERHVGPLLAALSRDKKNVDENLTVILSKGAGQMIKTKVPFDEKLKGHIKEYTDEHSRSI